MQLEYRGVQMKLIGKIKLRNEYEVYKEMNTIVIRNKIGKGTDISERRVEIKLIEKVYDILKNKSISIKEACSILKRYRLGFKYSYGYKFQFEVQDILISLVALDRGTLRKEDRKYVYSII